MVRAALLLATMLASAPAWADPAAFAECDGAITAASKLPGRVPDKLLPAIARVESGRLDASTGKVRAWPWTINVEGTGYFYDSKADVIAAVEAFQAKGKRSIDVGCMQVNLLHHPKAFASLDDAFDPATNARYAVKFLVGLYSQTKDWPLATAYYHSTTPDLGEDYQRLVFGKVVTPMGGSGGKPAAPAAAWTPPDQRYAAFTPDTSRYGAFTKPAAPNYNGVPMLAIGMPTASGKPYAAACRSSGTFNSDKCGASTLRSFSATQNR